MGFSSFDDLVNEMTANSKYLRIDWQKNFLPTANAVAGDWHCLARGGGQPTADSLYNTGTNLAFQAVSDTSPTAGGIQHGGNVWPDTKHIVNVSAVTAAATTAPFFLMLVDLVGFYRVTSVTTPGAQSLTNTLGQTSTFTADAGSDLLTHTGYALLTGTRVRCTTTTTLPSPLAPATDYYVIRVSDTTCRLATSYSNAIAGTAINIADAGTGTHTLNWLLPRYTNGAGVMAFAWNTNSTAMGAAAPTLTLGYTDQTQTGSNTTPSTPALPTSRSSAPNGLILYSGTGSGKYGPFFPLAQGDSGIAQADSINLNISHLSGEFSIGLCKPLLTIPVTTIGVASERDLLNQLPSLPRIYDGANLVWLMLSGAATVTNNAIYGHFDVVWG